MVKKEIIIETKEQLKAMLKSYRIHLIPRSRSRIIIRLKEYLENDNYYFTKKINSYYYSCGCREGALFFLTGIIIYILYVIFILNLKINILHIPLIIVYLFLLVTTGKFIGIFTDRIRLNFLVKKITKKE